MIGTKILSVGGYAPERIIENSFFEGYLETSAEWIASRTGIERRHIAKDEYTWEMGAKAAMDAIEKADISPASIDMIIGTTITNDYCTPSLASMVQKAIGAKNAVCYDINAACTGFIYGLDIASLYLETGRAKRILIVSAERMSKVMDYNDRSTCILFGDGAGAMLVEGDETMPAPVACIKSAIDEKQVLYCMTMDKTSPFDTRDNTLSTGGLQMNGREVYKFAVNALTHSVSDVLLKAGLTVDDIAMIVPHQANERIVKSAAQKLHVAEEKMMMCMADYGNTSSASIPLALCEMEKAGKMKKGDKLVLTGFGAGLTYGAILLTW